MSDAARYWEPAFGATATGRAWLLRAEGSEEAAPPFVVRVIGDAEPLDDVTEPDAEATWSVLRDRNPRLFNGPVLAVAGYDHDRREVTVLRSEFRRLAVQPAVNCRTRQLGVNAMLVAKDYTGRPHVLLGRRSRETRVFGGLWELAPSGGVDPPPRSIDRLDEADLWRALRLEVREELGLRVEPDPSRPVALTDDPLGGSLDLLYRIDLAETVEDLTAAIASDEQTSRWEYETTRWVALDDVAAFDAVEGDRIIPPTRASWRVLGLVP